MLFIYICAIFLIAFFTGFSYVIISFNPRRRQHSRENHREERRPRPKRRSKEEIGTWNLRMRKISHVTHTGARSAMTPHRITRSHCTQGASIFSDTRSSGGHTTHCSLGFGAKSLKIPGGLGGRAGFRCVSVFSRRERFSRRSPSDSLQNRARAQSDEEQMEIESRRLREPIGIGARLAASDLANACRDVESPCEIRTRV